MDLSRNAQQVELRNDIIAFARQSLADDLVERDRVGEFSHKLWQECARFGIQGLAMPEEFGGAGLDMLSTMLAMEALGYACPDQGLLFSLHAHMWAIQTPILRFGSDAQKQQWLPRLIDGSLIGAHAMSEPESGTDAFSLRTRAERRGDRWVLSGSKTFVTNAPVGGLFLVFATTDRKRGMWGITGFLIERDTKGLTLGKPLEKMGITTSPTGEVFLDECEVPAENMLGRVGSGATIFNHSMAWERSCILGSLVGGMERELEDCISYAKTRRQFGKPIGNFQLIAAKLADMKVRLETSRLLLYRAASSHGTGEPSPLDGALAKLHISEASVQSSLDAIQIHGGYGFMREYQMERHLRDNIATRLYSGTSEIQRLIIARHLGLEPQS